MTPPPVAPQPETTPLEPWQEESRRILRHQALWVAEPYMRDPYWPDPYAG